MSLVTRYTHTSLNKIIIQKNVNCFNNSVPYRIYFDYHGHTHCNSYPIPCNAIARCEHYSCKTMSTSAFKLINR